MKSKTLNDLKLFSSAKILKLNCIGTLRRRILDLGFIENSIISLKLKSPSSGIKAYEIRGTLVALRDEDASMIEIVPL